MFASTCIACTKARFIIQFALSFQYFFEYMLRPHAIKSSHMSYQQPSLVIAYHMCCIVRNHAYFLTLFCSCSRDVGKYVSCYALASRLYIIFLLCLASYHEANCLNDKLFECLWMKACCLNWNDSTNVCFKIHKPGKLSPPKGGKFKPFSRNKHEIELFQFEQTSLYLVCFT